MSKIKRLQILFMALASRKTNGVEEANNVVVKKRLTL